MDRTRDAAIMPCAVSDSSVSRTFAIHARKFKAQVAPWSRLALRQHTISRNAWRLKQLPRRFGCPRSHEFCRAIGSERIILFKHQAPPAYPEAPRNLHAVA